MVRAILAQISLTSTSERGISPRFLYVFAIVDIAFVSMFNNNDSFFG